ncbi:transglycosylase SLT domain-containing protein [Thiocystis minor]|uniref:transglycosylase SLT domain-containing protein n=1 Tax=Thiocystis minor TaxID=61597 RepID=UPI001914BBB2|nr:transglycosylase SLT domain-containing protein [Thiocystis minor]
MAQPFPPLGHDARGYTQALLPFQESVMPNRVRFSLALLGLFLATPTLSQAQPALRVIGAASMNPLPFPAPPAPKPEPDASRPLTHRTIVATPADSAPPHTRPALPVSAAGFLRGTLWETVAARVGLDPALLYGVALQETRHGTGAQASAPWPFTLRGPDGPQFHATKAAAAQALRQLTARHRPLAIDVGLMQVNLRWHGDTVADPADLLDARTNLIVAADILAKAIASAPGDLELGVGHYHHWHDEARARAYGRRVLQMAEALSAL